MTTDPEHAATRPGRDAAGAPLLEAAEWAVGPARAPLDPAVIRHAKRAIVDWFAATLPGARMEPARRLERALHREVGVGGRAMLLTSGARTSVRTAAVINGTASHTAELDDIFRDGLYHPGSPTVAAALAAAQDLGATGEELLRAVMVGFEISTRVAANLQPAHYRYWHTTGTVGTLGAAAAAASLLGSDRDQFAHAVATATTMAAGLQQAFRSDAMSKPLHAGHAAEAGALAALSAHEGFTGALDILEGEAGFGAAMSDAPTWENGFSDLGEHFNIGSITIKNHASCGHTFAAVDGALQLRETHDLTPADIQAIEVATYGVAIKVAGNPDPTTAFEAKFSLGYCVAAALQWGAVRLSAFDDDHLHDPDLRALLGRVTVTTDEELDRRFPTARAARTSIHLVDGTVVDTTMMTRKGDPDQPLTDDELREKFDELAVPCLGADAAATLATRLWELEALTDLADLVPAPPTP